MSDLLPDNTPDVLKTCRENTTDTSESLTGVFKKPVIVAPKEPVPATSETLPEDLQGPGLALVFRQDDFAAFYFIPESTGVLPEWYGAPPDATAESQFNSLAQEMSMQMLPEDIFCEKFETGRIKNIESLFETSSTEVTRGCIPMQISGEGSGNAALIWPAGDLVFPFSEPESTSEASEEAAPDETPAETPAEATEHKAPILPTMIDEGVASPVPVADTSEEMLTQESLPIYARSILKIELPVQVTLAKKTMPVQQLVDMGLGTILQFDKSCEQMLDLEVGNVKIGEGETVKVGDKFGLRVTAINMPEEQFQPVHSAAE